MVRRQTYCSASSRIKAPQRVEKKRYSDQEMKRGREEEIKAKNAHCLWARGGRRWETGKRNANKTKMQRENLKATKVRTERRIQAAWCQVLREGHYDVSSNDSCICYIILLALLGQECDPPSARASASPDLVPIFCSWMELQPQPLLLTR